MTDPDYFIEHKTPAPFDQCWEKFWEKLAQETLEHKLSCLKRRLKIRLDIRKNQDPFRPKLP